MVLPLDLSVRSAGVIFAIYVVAVMLLPASVLFALTGVALIGVGLFLLAESWLYGFLAIGAGVALIGLCVRTIRAARRHEEEQAREAAASVSRMSRMRGPR